jgi:ribosomal protein L11 methyltransferase
VWPEAAEIATDALAEITGAGVAIEPPIEALGPDEGYTLDDGAPLVLKAYLYGPVSASRRAAVRRRLRAGTPAGAIVGALRWRTLREEDWAESWKQYYDIEHVGRVVIRPAWREYEPAEGEIVVALDPGMAFGTGQHPTTRMCLAALQEIDLGGKRVLDLGAGSGILALAAAALGARYCLALDIEEQAVSAALANLRMNQAGDRIDIRLGSIEAAADLQPFDLILANINAAAIAALARDLAASLQTGGLLFAGGIIEERLAAPREALERAGFRIERVVAEGDWRTLIAIKP